MLDEEDLETIDSLPLDWLENLLEQYKKGGDFPCQIEKMTKLVKLKKERIEKCAIVLQT